MRRFIFIAVIAATLGGCAQLQAVLSAGSIATASIVNPVTPTMLYDAENAATVAFAGLTAYKRSCVARAIPSSCRTVIRNIQVYTRKLPSLLTSLRAFVRNNDQVNAVVAYNAITGLLADLKTVAAQNNVQVQ